MGKKRFMFAEDSAGNSREVKVDDANWLKQKRDLESKGFAVTVMDEDERIGYGLMAADIARQEAERG